MNNETNQLNDDNSRLLGIGETVLAHHWHRQKFGDDWDTWHPARGSIGHVIEPDDFGNEFRERIPSVTTDDVAKSLGLKTAMGVKALEVALENIKVLDSKQADYGSENISSFGEYGVLIRMTDKHARLKNLLTNSKEPKNESVMDTWLDMANYAIIAVLCRKGEWR